MLLHYLVKFRKLKMHTNTNLAFNNNYKRALFMAHGVVQWQLQSHGWVVKIASSHHVT